MVELHPLVDLARRSIQAYVREGKRIPVPAELLPEMQREAGAFVSIHRYGQLRGCIGTIQPTCSTVAEEVIENAIAAATCDPRFSPITAGELVDLEIKVDVLDKPEPVQTLAELDPRRYGLIVQSKKEPWKRGLLLPDLEGIDTVEKQVYWTRCHKAGINDPDEPVEMFRFEVHRYK
ncbi:MAG: AmmeMemoRadiSam system protein A [Anaerolineae bacterium]|nr:AmmeMemoRadiSam system protein A [Anaerolineae bacterium]MDX9829162.1 AmmeMemoRadiSam system protein A [Anaerolineae bacterium]